jgi:hypothetical protein
MDDTNHQARYETASLIAQAWGLSCEQRDKLLDTPQNVLAIISIDETLQRIFENDKDREATWLSQPNSAFGGASAINVMMAGNTEHVRTYLKYHAYNA